MDDDPILAAMRMTEDARALEPSATPLKDAIDKLGATGEGVELEAGRDTSGNDSVTLEATKNLGRGWSAGAAFSYVKNAGYAAWGKLTWTPRSKSK